MDFEKLLKESEDANEKKALLKTVGQIGQSMSDAPSFYELYKGKKTPGPNIAGVTDAAAGMVSDPMEKEAKRMAIVKQAYENQKMRREAGGVEKDSDPMSQASLGARALAKSYGLPVGDNDSAYDIERQYGLKNLVAKKYTDQADFDRQVQIARMNHENQLKLARMNNAVDRERIAATRSEKASSDDKANRQRAKEFQDRYSNIGNAIAELKTMIDDKGTYEATGPHNQTLSALIDSIAIDSAKMFDPQSVARESEVAAFKKMLFEPGSLTTRNSTAKGILDAYKNMLDSRAQTFQNTYSQPIERMAGPGGGGGGASENVANAGGKAVVKKQFSPSRNQTRVTYSDGTSEVLDGKR